MFFVSILPFLIGWMFCGVHARVEMSPIWESDNDADGYFGVERMGDASMNKWTDILDGRWDGGFVPRAEWGAGVRVIVLDSGCAWNPRSFVPGDANPASDEAKHGSYVATVISALAPSAEIWCWKIFDANGHSPLGRVLDALRAVRRECVNNIAGRRKNKNKNKNNTKCVLNLSLQSPRNARFNRQIRKVLGAGVRVIAAAGNTRGISASEMLNDACNFSPSSVVGVTVVGATDDRKTVASFSKLGRCVSLFAPGSPVVVGGKALYGTSFSVAVVSAHVAAFQFASVPSPPPIPQSIAGFEKWSVSFYKNLIANTTRDFVRF